MEKGMEISRRSFLSGMLAAGAVGASGAMGLVGSNSIEQAFADAAALDQVASGTATATVPGFGGDVTVTITMEEGIIVDCVIVGDNETPERGGRAIEQLQPAIVEAGSLDVDAVSGATVTSDAVFSAGTMAVKEIEGSGIVETGAALMAPGSYTATAKGFWDVWDTPVTVTVNEHAILDIQVPENRMEYGDTEIMMRTVRDNLIPRMLRNQSLKVDSITGATVTSNTVKSAAEQAVRQAIAAAGNDESLVSKFYTVPEKTEAGEVEEVETDTLFVGLGSPNLFAMARAIETMRDLTCGRKINVMGIEKTARVGGKSSLAHEYNGVNPPRLKEMLNGGNDFVDAEGYKKAWIEYYSDEDGTLRAKGDVIDMFFENSGNALDWLFFNQDWRFGTPNTISAFEGPVLWNCVLASGKDPGTFEDRRLAVDNFCRNIASRAEACGARILMETEAYDFIFEDGKCCGVYARSLVTGKEYVVRAKAVVLDTGGYTVNGEMTTNYANPQWAGQYEYVLSTGTDDGMMLQAAIEGGAGTWNMDMPPMTVNYTVPVKLKQYPVEVIPDTLNRLSGRESTRTLNDVPLALGQVSNTIQVNREGNRFGNEAANEKWKSGPYYYAIWSKGQLDKIATEGFTHMGKWMEYCPQGDIVPPAPGDELYPIIDLAIEAGYAWKGDSVEELAQAIGLDANNLTQAIDTYNASVAAGEDAEFGKDAEHLETIEEGPFYAVRILLVPYASGGGLDVDPSLRVLSSDHETPIEGLYATGGDCWGVLMHPQKHYTIFSGTALGWGLVSGYAAGAAVANYVNDTYGIEIVPEPLDDREISSKGKGFK